MNPISRRRHRGNAHRARRIGTCALMAGLAALALTSCQTVELSMDNLDVPVSMTSELGRDYRTVGHFREETRAWFAVVDIFTVIPPRMERQLERQLRQENGDAIVNLRITGTNTFWDFLAPFAVGAIAGGLVYAFGDGVTYADAYVIGITTASLLSRRTYIFEGDVARY